MWRYGDSDSEEDRFFPEVADSTEGQDAAVADSAEGQDAVVADSVESLEHMEFVPVETT